MTLDDWLADQKQRHGLSEQEFGESIGVTQAAVNRYRRKERRPAPDIALAISKQTKGAVTLDDLYAPKRRRAA